MQLLTEKSLATLVSIHQRNGDAKLRCLVIEAGPDLENYLLQSDAQYTESHQSLAAQLLTQKTYVITQVDADYPTAFTDWLGESAPPVLYVQGNLELLTQPTVAIIGTRHPTSAGIDAARAYAQRLAECEMVIVSGNAPGIDAAAHDEALGEGGSTIVFPPVPMDQFEPIFAATCDPKRVLICSALAPGSAVQPWCFLKRNSLVAAVAECGFVAETGAKGGTLDTVQKFRSMGKIVYATQLSPGSEYYDAHQLLESGGVKLLPAEPTVAALKLLSRPAAKPQVPVTHDLFSADSTP